MWHEWSNWLRLVLRLVLWSLLVIDRWPNQGLHLKCWWLNRLSIILLWELLRLRKTQWLINHWVHQVLRWILLRLCYIQRLIYRGLRSDLLWLKWQILGQINYWWWWWSKHWLLAIQIRIIQLVDRLLSVDIR